MNDMSEAPKASTSIVALVEATPVVVLTDKRKFSEFYEAMKAECDAHVPDLTTEKGRKAIASLAYKVARTKTAIDDAGKAFNEEARSRINAVDEARREIRAQLDELKDEVRRPLTDWEVAEAKREQKAAQEMQSLREMQRVEFDETAADVQERINAVNAMTINPDLHGAATEIAQNLRASTLAILTDAHARVVREEHERAELERLRAEAAEREEHERIKREAEEAKRQKEAAEKAAAEAKARAEAEQKAREEAAAKAAEQRARDDAEAKAREEREAAERAHAEALAAEKRRADEAEAAAQAERERIAAAEIAKGIEEAAAIKKQREREADRAHRGRIMGEAKAAIIECGVDEAVAKSIVLAIAANNVPHISIRF